MTEKLRQQVVRQAVYHETLAASEAKLPAEVKITGIVNRPELCYGEAGATVSNASA